MQYAMQ